jgi:DNA (cytosine-5)-methyltransferase 1
LGLPYVIENVQGAPMLTSFVLCGSMFGLRVRRHRLFETSFLVMPPRCDHKGQGEPVGVYGMGGAFRERPSGGSRGNKAAPAQYAELMEMPWAEPSEIRLAVPPAYTEFIGRQLLEVLTPSSSAPKEHNE